jgi:hypothetical protein
MALSAPVAGSIAYPEALLSVHSPRMRTCRWVSQLQSWERSPQRGEPAMGERPGAQVDRVPETLCKALFATKANLPLVHRYGKGYVLASRATDDSLECPGDRVDRVSRNASPVRIRHVSGPLRSTANEGIAPAANGEPAMSLSAPVTGRSCIPLLPKFATATSPDSSPRKLGVPCSEWRTGDVRVPR